MLAIVRAHISLGHDSYLSPSYKRIRTFLLSKKIYGENIYDEALGTAALARISLKDEINPRLLFGHILKLSEMIKKKELGKNPFYFYNIGYTGTFDLVYSLAIESVSNYLNILAKREPSSIKANFSHLEYLDSILSEQMSDGSFTALIKPSSRLYNVFVIFLYEYLGIVDQKKNQINLLIKNIFEQQKKNGALAGYPNGPDNIDISTGAYIAGKFSGLEEDDPRMKKLEISINEMGGPLKSNMLMLPYLILFNLHYVHSTYIFNIDKWLMVVDQKLPWVRFLIHPILYMIDNGHIHILSKDKYPSRIFNKSYNKYCKREHLIEDKNSKKFIYLALTNINTDGTFFDYTPTTIPMLMALSTFSPSYDDIVNSGIKSIENFQQTTSSDSLIQTPGEASIGETFYIANSLLDVGFNENNPVVLNAEKYLLAHQMASGGWGFSKKSVFFADSDDTSNVAYFFIRLDLARKKEIRPEVFHALHWILSIQNNDGGFGTWDKIKIPIIGNLINKFANKKGLVMSESVLEHTARIIVCLSFVKDKSLELCNAYNKAYRWLVKKQNADGSFAGTWFIDYLFSTSMGLTALSTDTESVIGHKAIISGINYLKKNIGSDGGFGESPNSFIQNSAVLLNKSSPTQTGLIVSQLHTLNIFSRCKYQNEMKEILETSHLFLKESQNEWTESMDQNWTAVTFPRVEYLIYPYIQRITPWQGYNMYINSNCH